MSEVETFLAEVDGDYRHRAHEAQPIISWKSSNTPVNRQFSLPIPIENGGAVVDYRFNTQEYDIEFSVIYTTNDNGRPVTEVVLPPRRFDSQIDPITGTFTMIKPGRLTLIWSNEYSWFKAKTLGYNITLHNASQLAREEAKCERALRALRSCCAEKEKVEKKQKELVVVQQAAEARLKEGETQLAALQARVEAEQQAMRGIRAEGDILGRRWGVLEEQVKALGIRTLTMALISRVLSFDVEAAKRTHALTCRDWRDATLKGSQVADVERRLAAAANGDESAVEARKG